MQLRFASSARTLVRGLEQVSHNAWLPYCLLLRPVHRLPSEPAGSERRFGNDPVGRVPAELNIEIYGHSSQAKGREGLDVTFHMNVVSIYAEAGSFRKA